MDKARTTPPVPCHAPTSARREARRRIKKRFVGGRFPVSTRGQASGSLTRWSGFRAATRPVCDVTRLAVREGLQVDVLEHLRVSPPAPPPDPPSRSAASPSTAAMSAGPPPPAVARCPRSAPVAVRAPSSRRTTDPNLRRPEPPAVSSGGAAGSACARSRGPTPAPAAPPWACPSARGGSDPPERAPCARKCGSRSARNAPPGSSCRSPDAARPTPTPGSARGRPESSSAPPGTRDAAHPWRSLPEGAHEARPAHRRHVVEHAQRDQHRAVRGDGAAAAVRDPRAADARPTGSRPCPAAAGRPELDAGLPRLAPTAGLPRPPLARVPGTTFPLHGMSPLWSCIGKKATRNYCICQQYSADCAWEHRSPPTEQGPFQNPVPPSARRSWRAGPGSSRRAPRRA